MVKTRTLKSTTVGLLIALIGTLIAIRGDGESLAQGNAKSGAAQKKAAGVPAKATGDVQSAEEKAIRAASAAAAEAYNRGDAKELAALFTPDAEIVDEDGATVHGRDNIEKL